MSNSNNDEKKGKEIDHDLAKLVKEIFNTDGKLIQPTEEYLATEDQIYYDALSRGIIRTINDLFEFMEPYLMQVMAEYFKEEERKLANARNKLAEVLKELVEEERKHNFSQQSTGSP
jgi:DNA polymerase III delta prime subunit